MNTVGDEIIAQKGNWTFSGEVSMNFDSHVSKSVPMYNEGHQIICNLSDFFLSNNSLVYDLGCSTGSLIEKIAIHNTHKKEIKYIGVDQEVNMIKQAKERKSNNKALTDFDIEFLTEDINLMKLEKTNLIICYYLTQFIRPHLRQDLIDNIYKSLHWGGCFILFEKVRGSDARFQDLLVALYNDYKVSRGYSVEEINSKALSLRGVLEPFSRCGNIDMLKRAGFVDIESIFKYVCFEGFIAIK